MRYFLLLFFISSFNPSLAQDGRVFEQTAFTLNNTDFAKVKPLVPELKALLTKVNFYRITYLSDGLKVKGYMATPKKPGKYPCVIYNRGGTQDFGKIDDSGFIVRGLGNLSMAGYIVVASQYRGNDGGEGKEEWGGRDINDVLNLIPLLSSIPGADTSRIGMFGWSRGGMMTYVSLTKTSKIKAAVVGAGLSDLIKAAEVRPEFDTVVFPRFIPDYKSNKEAVLKERSAIYLADKICKTTPILIFQGTADWRVSTNHVLELVNKFYEVKQPFRFVLFEGGEHSLIEHRKEYIAQMINWFHTYLRDRKPWPSLDPHGD